LPLVEKIQKYTGLPASLVAFIGLNYLVITFFRGGFNQEIMLCIATLYPGFKSIQALQTDTDPDDDKTWLTYWMCYGCLTVADMHIGFVLSWIPFYYTLKFLFLIWLQLPLGPFMGAKIVYRVILQPLFRFIGPRIKKFQEDHADDIYDLNINMATNLADL